MRLLVTGATGFVGSHLIPHLLSRGDGVVGLARQPAERAWPLVTADLLDQKTTAQHLRTIQPEGIIHLAGWADVGSSFREPAGAWRDNLEATLSLYQAIEDWGGRPRVLFVSTGAVYGPGATAETSELRPASPYAASKAAADLASYQVFCHPGLAVIRVRPFNQIGPGQSPRYAVAAFAEQIARIEAGLLPPIIETGRLDVTRNLTDVRDMVVAYRLLLERGEPGEVYNAASSVEVSIQHVLDELVRISGVRAEIRSTPGRMRPGDVERSFADAVKLSRATGWEPHISLDQSLRDILDDWRQRVRQI
ncbi:MAG: GDP-mannose 4,6-dehydratase [Gemmataceae bacterium]